VRVKRGTPDRVRFPYSRGVEETITVAVEVPLVGDERHKNWAKVVETVDSSKTSGWAYEGAFVEVGGIQDLPVGGVLLVYGERGSRANPQVAARVYRVNGDATLTLEADTRGRAWARTLRDPIERLLEMEPPSPDLSGVSDDVMVAELRSRGWRVEAP
jgi:hypothetical protein